MDTNIVFAKLFSDTLAGQIGHSALPNAPVPAIPAAPEDLASIVADGLAPVAEAGGTRAGDLDRDSASMVREDRCRR